MTRPRRRPRRGRRSRSRRRVWRPGSARDPADHRQAGGRRLQVDDAETLHVQPAHGGYGRAWRTRPPRRVAGKCGPRDAAGEMTSSLTSRRRARRFSVVAYGPSPTIGSIPPRNVPHAGQARDQHVLACAAPAGTRRPRRPITQLQSCPHGSPPPRRRRRVHAGRQPDQPLTASGSTRPAGPGSTRPGR